MAAAKRGVRMRAAIAARDFISERDFQVQSPAAARSIVVPGASTAIVGVGITFRRDLSGALLIHQIVQVCPCLCALLRRVRLQTLCAHVQAAWSFL